MTDHKHTYDRVSKLAGSWIACVDCGEPYRGNFLDALSEREALLAVTRDIERRASLYADRDGNPGPLADTWGWRIIAEQLREALAALPEHLK